MKLTKNTIKKLIKEEVEGAFLESEPFEDLPKRLTLLSAAVRNVVYAVNAGEDNPDEIAQKMINSLQSYINLEAKRLKRGY